MTQEIDDRPLTAGVCGDPVAQSKSPILFRHWFERYGISGHYVPLEVASADFEHTIRGLLKAGFRGVNCTIPHKVAALEIADEVSPSVAAIGAANTLVFQRDGTINADNTDAFGFIANLRAGAPDWTPAAAPAVMLGAGGAARAGIFALLEAGVPTVRVLNRTREKANALAEHFGERVEALSWEDRHGALDGAGLIVNSTSLGMVGSAPLDLALDDAPSTAVVTDMVYNPLETELLASARNRGLRTVDGLGMLLHQARPGFRAWFGADPEVTPDLRAACLKGAS
ncbi:MAG: shikimate dehydrogenase [Pseudomonadota bacterium]